MPSMPWTSTAPLDRDRTYLVMATRSKLTSRRHLPAIFGLAQPLWAGLSATDGLIGYTMHALVRKATIATLTVWQDPATLSAFVRGQQHAAVAAATRHWMRESVFVSWTATAADLPPDWATADRHLDAAPPRKPHPLDLPVAAQAEVNDA